MIETWSLDTVVLRGEVFYTHDDLDAVPVDLSEPVLAATLRPVECHHCGVRGYRVNNQRVISAQQRPMPSLCLVRRPVQPHGPWIPRDPWLL